MEILVLAGLPNKGKTTTIIMIYDLVLSSGGISTNKQPLGNEPLDFSDIVTNYNNKKIAFYSAGDNSTELSKAIKYYNKLNCDLLICCLSTGSVKKRANNALNAHNATRISKTITNIKADERIKNLSDARVIFNLV